MPDIVTIRKLEKLEGEVERLKSETGRTPLRIEMPLPAEAGEVRKFIRRFAKTMQARQLR